MQVPDT